MKTCSYCGKKYSEDVAVCPVDGQPLSGNDDPLKGTTFTPKQTFEINLTSPISRSGTYRVFVERADLIFIRIEGGGNPVVKTLAHFLGPFGNLIPLAFWLFDKSKATTRREHLKETSPDELLRESDGNFRLHVAEIRDASVEPPSFITKSGKAGRLNFVVRHGEKFRFEFAETSEIRNAIRLLAPMLNSTLKVSPQWNEETQQFEKRKRS